MPNSAQFFQYNFYVAGAIGSFIVTISFITSQQNFKKAIGIALVVITFTAGVYYSPFHQTNVVSKREILGLHNKLPGGEMKFLYFRHTPENSNFYTTTTEVYFPVEELQTIYQPLVATCINPEAILSEPVIEFPEAREAYVWNSPIFKFYRKRGMITGQNEIPNAMMRSQFISEYQINGLLIHEDSPFRYHEIADSTYFHVKDSLILSEGWKLFLIQLN
jgi:hypothetical protein